MSDPKKPGDSRAEEQAPDLLAMMADPAEVSSAHPTAITLALLARRPGRVALLAIAPGLAFAGLLAGAILLPGGAAWLAALPLVALAWYGAVSDLILVEAAGALGAGPPTGLAAAARRGWPLGLLVLVPFLAAATLGDAVASGVIGLGFVGVVMAGMLVVPALFLERQRGPAFLWAVLQSLVWRPPEARRVSFWQQAGARRAFAAAATIPLLVGGPFVLVPFLRGAPLLVPVFVMLLMTGYALMGQLMTGIMTVRYLVLVTVREDASPLLAGSPPAALPPEA